MLRNLGSIDAAIELVKFGAITLWQLFWRCYNN